MVTITRQTLMLRGVSVLGGEQTAWMRLGGEDRVRGEAPAFPISMRHPSPSSAGLNRPAVRLYRVHEKDADAAASRAGRSDCLAGVLDRRSSALLRCGMVFRPCHNRGGRSQTSELRPLAAGGLSLPSVPETQERSKAKPAGSMPSGRTRFAAARRGRGVA
jgi:hypothetical protein